MRKSMKNLFICLGLILSIGGTSIYALTEVSVENHFTTGVVDIELDEYTIENGSEVLWKDDIRNLLPGQDVSKIPRITNYGNDCYIRAKIEFEHTTLNKIDLYGIPASWYLAADGYYYYTEVLCSGESVELFKGFKVPNDFEQKTEDSAFQIKISIDAVQSDHFTPNYTRYDPWGTVEILECEKEGMYDVSTLKKPDSLNFNIRYKDFSGKLIKNEDDFFANFPVLLPGDTYTDTLEIVNESKKTIHLYFRTRADEGTELLDKISLKIIKQFHGTEEMIYYGSLRGTDLKENILLAEIAAETDGKITYEIHVPEELNNAYTLMKDHVFWVFATEPVESIDAVETGDTTLLICYCLFSLGIACAIVGVGFGVYEKVRKQK